LKEVAAMALKAGALAKRKLDGLQISEFQRRPVRPGQYTYVRWAVARGDTLVSIASSISKRSKNSIQVTWDSLAEFNFGTSDPVEVNRWLLDACGCTEETKDRWNYMFSGGELLWAPTAPAGSARPEVPAAPGTVAQVQRCTHGHVNCVNDTLPLPVIDAHCHVFGQALYEGGDLIQVGSKAAPGGGGAFLKCTMKLDDENAATVLAGVDARPGLAPDTYPIRDRVVAIVPLLLDLGYTPLISKWPILPNLLGAIMPNVLRDQLRSRGQTAWTESEQIAATDYTRSSAGKTGRKTLSLESLYCVKGDDYTGDDDVRIEVYQSRNGALELIKVIPVIIVDHDRQLRMINEEVLLDETADAIEVRMWELDIVFDDVLGRSRIWPLSDVRGAECKFNQTRAQYTLTYSICAAAVEAAGEEESKTWVLALEHLHCIEQQDRTGSDSISIKIDCGGLRKEVGPYACKTGRVEAISRNMNISSNGVEVALWELDMLDSNDRIGCPVRIDAREVLRNVAEFKRHDAHYRLTYSVAPSVACGEVGEPEPEYYARDKTYLWFKRDRKTFEGTIRALSRAAATYPGQVWPFVPFDPRRPDGLDCVQRAIGKQGFVGVKTYSRCGWMPIRNYEMHGDKIGKMLDERLMKFYKYLTDYDVPLLNHTSPTGFPPEGQLALPRAYCAKGLSETGLAEQVAKLGFPPIVSSAGRLNTLRTAVVEACAGIGKYCHYVQKSTSPYAWDGVLEQFATLRLSFGHCGSEVGMYHRYEKMKMRADSEGVFNDAKFIRIRTENPFVGRGEHFREGFVKAVTKRVLEAGPAHPGNSRGYRSSEFVGEESERYSEAEIEGDVGAFLAASEEWQKWLADWGEAYPADWTSKIIELQRCSRYANVYADISYLTGSSKEVHIELLRNLVNDALDGGQGGTILADRLMIGTDWYMTVMDGVSPEEMWSRMRKAMGMDSPGKAPERWAGLWKKWVTTNTLEFLNLKPRLEDLARFYMDHQSIDKEKMGLPPDWWEAMGYVNKEA
jgi:predicted TIM-barrel fold metal-dependent hydrolase